MMTTERDIRATLDDIKDPCSVAASIPMGLDEMGIVKSVAIADSGQVDIGLRLTSPVCEMIGYMRKEAIARIGALPGVTGVSVSHDSGLDWDHDMIAPEAQARRQHRLAMLRDMPQPRSAGHHPVERNV
jgi:metal-sulfur cluster biosynthetic enzyme